MSEHCEQGVNIHLVIEILPDVGAVVLFFIFLICCPENPLKWNLTVQQTTVNSKLQ